MHWNLCSMHNHSTMHVTWIPVCSSGFPLHISGRYCVWLWNKHVEDCATFMAVACVLYLGAEIVLYFANMSGVDMIHKTQDQIHNRISNKHPDTRACIIYLSTNN